LPNIVGIDIAKFFASTVVCTCVLACILLYAPTRCSAVFCDNNTISHKCLSLQRYRVDTTFIMRHLKVGSHILPGGVRGSNHFTYEVTGPISFQTNFLDTKTVDIGKGLL